MATFKERARYTEVDARRLLAETTSSMFQHLLDNEDGTFSIMAHIVCEYCDYCVSQGDARGKGDITAVPAKPDPYEIQGR